MTEPPPDPPPLIVTLTLAADDQAAFEAERRAHFPRALNRIPAHVSLFHALPGERAAAVADRLRDAAAIRAFPLRVAGPMMLGRGVAWRFDAPPLLRLRAALATDWVDWLTPQDRQGYRPHLTIQNKVAPDAARALYDELLRDFRPRDAMSHGLSLWRYLGGPWEAVGEFPFAT